MAAPPAVLRRLVAPLVALAAAACTSPAGAERTSETPPATVELDAVLPAAPEEPAAAATSSAPPRPAVASTGVVRTDAVTTIPPTVATTSAATSTSSATPPTTAAPAALRSLTIVAAGDILTERLVLDAGAAAAGPGERYDFAPLFAPIEPLVAAADLAICHVELPVGEPGATPGVRGKSPNGGNLLLAPYEIVEAVRDVGFDRCSTASNHSLDLGVEGVAWTLDALDAVAVGHTGTARSEAEAAVDVFDVAGVRVAHLSFTDYSNAARVGETWTLNFALEPETVAADVLRARAAGAEIVVVSMHVAKEMLPAPIGYDRAFVEDLTAMVPVDLVVQHGPHVVQPVEVVNGTVVYWSVGNLVSGMGVPGTGKYEDPRTLDGLLARVRFTEVEPGRFVAESSPVAICNERTSRTVHAPSVALLDPSLPDGLRTQLEACVERIRRVHPDLG